MKYGRTVAMSNNYWDEDEDEDTTTQPLNDSDVMKQLRKAKRSDEKRIKELTEKLEAFDKAQRESVIKKVLENKGVSPKAARLIVRELEGDISEDSVSNWIDDNADVFGLQVQQVAPEQTLDRAALRQQDIVTQAAITPDRAADSLLRLNNAASAEEIIAMIQSGEF
jgi:hypothetical protein